MAITISGNSNSTIYGKGDVCLQLNPFDCYRMFTLYENWRSDDRKPINLSGDQKIYLVFKSKNKEIRIPEYNEVMVYTPDKVNGQVLFKISQKNAIDILALDNRIFYITRMHETYDLQGQSVVSSDEEVIYVGQWKDESSNLKEDFTSQIKQLTSLLEERNLAIKDLQESNAQLIKQNVDMAMEKEELKKANENLELTVSELEAENDSLKSGAELSGTVIGKGDHYTIYEFTDSMTEEQMEQYIKEHQNTSQM